jgi:AcrR family transcriptional regulator
METVARTQTAAPRLARREAIWDAVFELLGEVGYDQMSMDAVAARARASKATIYRSWPNKPDLVVDALVHRFGPVPQAPDTGSLRGDLLAVMTAACQMAGSQDGAVMVGLMTAATRHPELHKAIHQCAYDMKHVVHATIVRNAVARGELPGETDPGVLHEVMHAMVFTQKVWAEGPLDDDFVVHVVDAVLIPVVRRGCAEEA